MGCDGGEGGPWLIGMDTSFYREECMDGMAKKQRVKKEKKGTVRLVVEKQKKLKRPTPWRTRGEHVAVKI